MFVLVYKEMILSINDLGSSFPSIVSSSLQAFEDGLSGLPPFKGIEHQVDFSLGATIRNQLTYRTNPEETKKLQCQVEELIVK